jgi:inorganic pyrophosphatase
VLDIAEVGQLVTITGAVLGVTAIPIIRAFDQVKTELKIVSVALAVQEANARSMDREIEILRGETAHLRSKFADLD